jgi:hypothetical protein
MILTDSRLEKYKYAIEEIEVPNTGDKIDVQSTAEHSHKPFVDILFW